MTKTKTETKSSNQSNEHILVCLSPSPSNERIVRMAAQMAQAFGGTLTALYVQTPGNRALSSEDEERLQTHVRLATELGAEIVTTHGDDVPTQIAEYARVSGITKIVLGRSGAERRHFWNQPSLTERLTELAPTVEIHIIPDADLVRHTRRPMLAIAPTVPTLRDLVLTLVIQAVATIIGFLFFRLHYTDANIITIYLLGVLLTSVSTSGYTCGLLASVLSVFLFNYFLTEPRLTLVAYGKDYPVTFAVMLGASILAGTLAAKLKAHAELSARDAYRTKTLFDANQQLQKAETPTDIYRTTATQIQRLVQRDILIYPAMQLDVPYGQTTGTTTAMQAANAATPSPYAPATAASIKGTSPSGGVASSRFRYGYLFPANGGAPRSIPENACEPEVVDWVFQHRKRAGASTEKFQNAHCLYLSIRTGQQVYGVVGVPCSAKAPLDAFTSSILLSILGECALALESLHNAEEREKAAVLAKNEQLRANLLRSISHDLRTPLTSISGNADALLHSYQALDDDSRTQMITDIYDDAQWLTELVENLLAVTKISDGSVKLQLSDQVVDDIVAEALRHIDRHATEHHITSDCGEMPLLVRADARLIMQLLINLVNNAIKYTPAGSHIEIHAFREAEHAVIEVSDDGPGIPDAQKAQVFEMFYTGSKRVADSRRSLGLGLSLCRSIVHAHDGELSLHDNTPHGCVFSFTLPLSEINLNM